MVQLTAFEKHRFFSLAAGFQVMVFDSSDRCFQIFNKVKQDMGRDGLCM